MRETKKLKMKAEIVDFMLDKIEQQINWKEDRVDECQAALEADPSSTWWKDEMEEALLEISYWKDLWELCIRWMKGELKNK